MKAKQFVLHKRPIGIPDESAFSLESITVPDSLRNKELRLHGLYYSVDPYMRVRMNAEASYIAPFVLDHPMEGHVIARVTESKCSDFAIGDLVIGQLPWATEMVVQHEGVKKIDLQDALATESLGILGMTGLTAYFGLLKMGEPNAGETVLISGAAGAVGSVAGQIAKLKGCRVVGIVGSEEKAALLKQRFHFDAAINYKNAKSSLTLKAELKEACPNGIDIYFDNVGGPISDLVLEQMNTNGRVILCGQIALYNLKETPKHTDMEPALLAKSISMRGFNVANYQDHFPEALRELSVWLSQGRLDSCETIMDGFENLPKALIGLFSGKNIGKMIVKAAA